VIGSTRRAGRPDAAVSLVPPAAHVHAAGLRRSSCGFNPLAVDAPADVIADYVVAALKNLFSDVKGILQL